jgi:hypothetical protein
MRRLLGLLIIFILTSCGTPPVSPIVGHWQEAKLGFTLTYTADGIVYFEGASNLNCYTITGDKVRIASKTAASDIMIIENTVAFDGDTMVFTGPDGRGELTRVDTKGTLSEKGLQATLEAELADPQTQRCPQP